MNYSTYLDCVRSLEELIELYDSNKKTLDEITIHFDEQDCLSKSDFDSIVNKPVESSQK